MTQLRAGVYGRQSRNKTKSIAEQVAAGTAVAAENGWTVAGTYTDGTSASRYARRDRDDWRRCLADIAAGQLDVIILWEASRGDRTLTTWAGLLELCRDAGVSIHVINDERTYDPRRTRDWKTLATSGVDSASESDLLSSRVKRGLEGAAALGKPGHGRCPFGYRRVYDPANGALTGQEPDPAAAPIVREVFARLAAGEPISAIVDDFNTRDVPTVGAKKWYRVRVRDIGINRVYIGERVHNGVTSQGTWTPLVDESQFYAVARILSDPQRVTTRPGRVKHLLSYLGVCGVCGAQLTAVRGRYRCLANGCVTIVQADADAFVTAMVLGKLSQADVYETFRQHGEESDRSVIEARAEVDKLTEQLKTWRRSAAAGETSPASLATIEAELTGRIRALARRTGETQVPPELRAILRPGEDVAVRWENAPLQARRRVISHTSLITVGQADKPGSRLFDFNRLGGSRWSGDPLTWGERWAADSA